MTARQQRRAAERLSQNNQNRGAQPPSSSSPAGPERRSERPIAAPLPERSEYQEHTAASKLALLLPAPEAELYRTHLLHFLEQHRPAPGVESILVQRLADVQWRLLRTANLEAAIMALGQRKYAELFPEAESAVRIALLDAHTLISEGLALKRLHTQETRLRRFYSNDLAELAELQENRIHPQSASGPAPIAPGITVNSEGYTSIPLTHTDEDGFEFSIDYEIDLSDEPDPAACLEFMLGSEFSTDVMCAGTAPGIDSK